MIGLTRLYCHQGHRFQLVDVPSQDADDTVAELRKDGWEIEAEIPV